MTLIELWLGEIVLLLLVYGSPAQQQESAVSVGHFASSVFNCGCHLFVLLRVATEGRTTESYSFHVVITTIPLGIWKHVCFASWELGSLPHLFSQERYAQLLTCRLA
jgi:hypothetical protein